MPWRRITWCLCGGNRKLKQLPPGARLGAEQRVRGGFGMWNMREVMFRNAGLAHGRDGRLISLGVVPAEGFEPPTNGLQNRCSTTELSRQTEMLQSGQACADDGALGILSAVLVAERTVAEGDPLAAQPQPRRRSPVALSSAVTGGSGWSRCSSMSSQKARCTR